MNESRRYEQDDRFRRAPEYEERRRGSQQGQPNWRPSPAQDESWRYQDDGRFTMSPPQEGYQPYSDGWLPQSQPQNQGWRSQNDSNWRSQGDGNWRSQGDGYRSPNEGGRWQEDWRAQNQGYGQNQGNGRSDSRFGQGRDTGWGTRDYSLGRQDFALRDGISSSGEFAGRGPKGYARSDDRIREEVSDRLTDDPSVDASEIEVEVKDGRVTLTGTCDDRQQKRRAEDLAEQCSGVQDVMNHIRVEQNDRSAGRDGQASKSTQSQSSSRGATGTNPTRRGSSTESM